MGSRFGWGRPCPYGAWGKKAGGLLFLCLVSLCAFLASGAETTNKPPETATNAAAIPLLEIPTEAQSSSTESDNLEAEISQGDTASEIESEVPGLATEISNRLQENARLLASAPSLENLSRLAREWQDPRLQIANWKKLISKRSAELDLALRRVLEMQQKWNLTRDSIQKDTKAPPELLQRVEALLERLKKIRATIETEQARLLALQTQLTEQETRIAQAENAISRASSELIGHLLTRDSPPLWSSQIWSRTNQAVVREGQDSLWRQTQAIAIYAGRRGGRFLLHLALLVGLTALFSWIEKRLQTTKEHDPAIEHAARVFEIPFATAIVISLFASRWIYPQAPRLFVAVLGAAALIPATVVLRRVIPRELFPVLNILVFFYFIDQVRTVVASQPLLSRLLLAGEMLIGLLFALWLFNRYAASPPRIGKRIRIACKALAGCFALAFAADLLGFVGLAKFIAYALLSSAYLGMLLYALVNIFEGLIVSALINQPMSRFALVRKHRAIFQKRAAQFIAVAALILWVLFLMEALALRGPIFKYAHAILTYQVAIRSFHITLADFLLFIATIWLSFWISRFVQFALQEEVYPRVQLAPGLHYSISKFLHYIIIVIGFLIGFSLLGFNLSKFTILVSAFGVGLGFGLQNIVNNFVSGIILLFERPIKVGDVIQFDVNQGVVRRIGIRASVIKTTSGSEIIIPNGRLISDPVTNWTFSRRQQLIDITLGVAPGPDARRVIEILKNIAGAQPQIVKDPEPQIFLLNMNGGQMNFQIRAWTDRIEDSMRVRSDLFLAIASTLSAENMTIK